MSSGLQHAVPAVGLDAPLPWHFGDPLREQRALAGAVGVVDRSNRDVLQVTGPERLPWLHSICSQHVSDLQDGDATEALVLSPHGHVEQHWQSVELAATFWIDTEPGAAPTVLKYLQMMRFLKRVEPVDVSSQWSVLTVVGPATPDALRAAGLPLPDRYRAVGLEGGGIARRMAWPATDAVDLLVPRAGADAMLARLHAAGAQPAGLWAFEALRVEARRPRLGLETDHRTIPHEVGWIGSAVHLNKGCYRGQETVARVHNLGRPPRRLVLLHLSGDSDDSPAAGTPVEVNGRAVGFVGTAVQHHELGPIALALVKRSIDNDARPTVAGAPVGLDASGS
jgi:folate-binding protein YgfZ